MRVFNEKQGNLNSHKIRFPKFNISKLGGEVLNDVSRKHIANLETWTNVFIDYIIQMERRGNFNAPSLRFTTPNYMKTTMKKLQSKQV